MENARSDIFIKELNETFTTFHEYHRRWHLCWMHDFVSCVGVVGMSLVQSSFPESLDQVLDAVRETPRGRWFLENYESRLRNDGTSKVLDSIAKLEKHIQTLSVSNVDATLVARARAAIAAARHDIAAIEEKPAELSNEAQLFAKLASLAKNANSETPAISQGVERALRLVSELDQELNTAQAAKPAEAYFKQDDAVFEPAPAPKIVKTINKPEVVADAIPRGAKLSIQRSNSSAKAAAPVEKPQDVLVEPVTQPESIVPQSRIVIIRRKADEATEVPLLEQAEAVSAA
jgi:hypothetical protein